MAAQGHALGTGAQPLGSPERAQQPGIRQPAFFAGGRLDVMPNAWNGLFRPCRALPYRASQTQGVALGLHVPPLQGEV